LPTLVTENDMAACCACVGAVKLSPVKATAAKTDDLIANIMRTLLFGGLHVKDSRKTRFARCTSMAQGSRRWIPHRSTLAPRLPNSPVV
jgi:hypothetical protein